MLTLPWAVWSVNYSRRCSWHWCSLCSAHCEFGQVSLWNGHLEKICSVLLRVCGGFTYHLLKCSIGGSCRVTLVVAFACVPQNFGKWRGPANGILSVCEKLYINWWWEHSNSICCNPFNLNFLHSQSVGKLKHRFRVRSRPRATLWNFS